MTDADFEPNSAHRWFAVNCNNSAWDLIESAPHSEDDVEHMIHAAHASAWHWLQVGTPAHHVRALHLLTNAYAAAADGATALRYAQQAAALSEQHKHELTPFDQAMTEASLAAACSCAGEADRANSHGENVSSALSDLEEDEKSVVEAVLRRAGL